MRDEAPTALPSAGRWGLSAVPSWGVAPSITCHIAGRKTVQLGMLRSLIKSLFVRLGISRHFASGGSVPPWKPQGDAVPVILSPGRRIADPDEAEALGMTADARRLRARDGEGA